MPTSKVMGSVMTKTIIMMIMLMVVILMRNNSDNDDFADYLTIPRVVPLDVQNGKLAFKRIIIIMTMRRLAIMKMIFDIVLDCT